jgi:uncharacterized protein (DUF4415 family)
MGMTTLTISSGQKPTKEQLKEIRAAARQPITYTADCPASTPAALKEFAAKARELRQRNRQIKPAVTIRIMPECLELYKALGKGYTGVMADVLDYVAKNPALLQSITAK